MLAVLACLLVLTSGCRALGFRGTVDETQARDLLATAAGLAASGQVDRLCELAASDASTCPDSLIDYSMLVPASGPTIACVVPAPDTGPLRHGQVLVLEGVDANDHAYITEFVVFDDGETVGVLDPVFWNGLTIASYSEDTVTWRFDSSSTTCDRGGLPVEPAVS